MSTSPCSEAQVTDNLCGALIQREELSEADRAGMYLLLKRYFDGVRRDVFDADLNEKSTVILLRSRTGAIQGFSTLMRLNASVDGQKILAFFSGDTIVERRYWGESLLGRLWAKAVFTEADRIAELDPDLPMFWFLICSGYKTYRFLPVFFRSYYPNPYTQTPPEAQKVLDALGNTKFPGSYDETCGVVRLKHAAPLRPGVAEITAKRLRDPFVAFFAVRNPGHSLGDELACLAPISHQNLTRAGLRMIRAGAEPE